jgi:hypothetical protein
MDPTPAELIYTRENDVLSGRREQLTTNLLALKGGRPYLDARLWRAPNESDLSWEGKSNFTGQKNGAVGRRARSALINDFGRVSQKINQYLFSKPVQRAGIDAEWAGNVTGTGLSINAFFMDASEMLTACGWAWIQVDRGGMAKDPVTGKPKQRTLAERISEGDRVRWSLWSPLDVVDWSFDANGRLMWLITQEQRTDNQDPFKKATTKTARRFWQYNATGATWTVYEKTKKSVVITDAGTVSSPEIPFICIGTPSPDPWWSDDVEMMQCQLMNLDSLHVDNLVKTSFPQLIIAMSQLDAVQTRLVEQGGQIDGVRILQMVKEITRGLESPMVETAEDSGTTRYIAPDAANLSALVTEIDRKRKLLFDSVGLALFNRETRQIQTAESKAFDHLDTESTLRHRAIVMQECEQKCVAASLAIDTMFAEYDPQWPQDFGIVDAQTNASVITQLGNLPGLVLTYRKALQRAAGVTIESIIRLSDDEKEAAAEEIDAMEDDNFMLPDPDPAVV